MDPSTTLDPATGEPLPPDAIVRVLHITSRVHVYSIPRDAVSTTRGYTAATWTADARNPIFTARLRVLETSFSAPSPSAAEPATKDDAEPDPAPTLKVDILLEDPASGALFAAAPYTAPAAVEPAADSARFFALRVRDPTGRQKATLGVGFEERSDAFDFAVALQGAGRALARAGLASFSASLAADSISASSSSSSGVGQVRGAGEGGGNKGPVAGTGLDGQAGEEGEGEKRDLSLKEGETIRVNLAGTRFGRRRQGAGQSGSGPGEEKEEEKEGDGGGTPAAAGQGLAAFALPPPPPPSAREVRAQKRLSAQQLGFDDGQFGEFA